MMGWDVCSKSKFAQMRSCDNSVEIVDRSILFLIAVRSFGSLPNNTMAFEVMNETITDAQGNPINPDGSYIVDVIGSIKELTDEDFTAPRRTVQLPAIPEKLNAVIGANKHPIIIKKNIFAKNAIDHKDLTPEQSREIIFNGLYNTNLYGQSKKISRPHYWVVLSTINAKGKNRIVLLEVNNTKENVEIVHWHYIRNDALKTLKRQAGREGGHILVLPSEKRKRPVAFPAVRSIRLFLSKILKKLQKQVFL